MARWQLSYRFDPHGRPIADQHYNRRAHGSKQYAPPGRLLQLVIPGAALWATSWPFAEYVRHKWPGAWVNSTFRNQLRRPDGTAIHLSSELIWEAIAITRRFWQPPELGMISFVDPRKVKRKRDAGRCYRKVGFKECGYAKDGKLCLQLLPHEMPEPCMDTLIGEQLELTA